MEPGFVALLVVVTLAIGIIIGRFVARGKIDVSDTQGILYVNRDATEGQGLFLVQTVSEADIISRKYVVFEVDVIG